MLKLIANYLFYGCPRPRDTDFTFWVFSRLQCSSSIQSGRIQRHFPKFCIVAGRELSTTVFLLPLGFNFSELLAYCHTRCDCEDGAVGSQTPPGTFLRCQFYILSLLYLFPVNPLWGIVHTLCQNLFMASSSLLKAIALSALFRSSLPAGSTNLPLVALYSCN
jgi:hypothetical protein